MNPWILAIRPKTLAAGIAPVLIGSAMAFGDGSFHPKVTAACLAGSLLIQIGTNLANDYFDFKKGADANRQGPTRVTQAGLIAPQTVLQAAVLAFLLAALCSVFLVYRGGLPIAIIAVVSIICGFLYTAGPKPLAYLGLGELFVFFFFGPVAVGGTYYLLTFDLNWAVVVSGFAPGLLSCAILAVNNLRDIEGDKKAGKKTLAVRFGKDFAQSEYLFCMMAAAMCPFVVFMITHDHSGMAAGALIGLLSIGSMKTVMTFEDPQRLNEVLAETGRWLLMYSILFSIGWILCSR